MLNGLDPILIFNFKRLVPTDAQRIASCVASCNGVSSIPVTADKKKFVNLPPIPVYLSEKLTGIYIDTEEKNVDIETTTDASADGETIKTDQKSVASTITISMVASKNSLGVTLLSAMSDVIFKYVSSKQYSVTYFHGAVTLINGLLHSFAITQNADDDLYKIKVVLIRGENKTKESSVTPETPRVESSVLQDGSVVPAAPAGSSPPPSLSLGGLT
jgi:hypothetical protein